jgi:pimeloyl-ACP methyl ester carboxylesterase
MNPALVHWPSGIKAFKPRAAGTRALVFVHGIYSDHNTFEVAHRRYTGDARFNDFEFFYFDYDFNQPLEYNGRAFATQLRSTFRDEDFVAIVAHSMGGLVARIAVLAENLPFVRNLFLLGTPNLGAIRTSQLAFLAQLAASATRALSAVFARQQGLTDLTRARDILLPLIEAHAERADDVDYVSIPGLYFNDSRSLFSIGQGVAGVLFSALRTGLVIVDHYVPLFGIKLSDPHDGIVERKSNQLPPCEAGRESEKKDSINLQASTAVTYLHVETVSCAELNHIQIQSDRDVLEVMAEIVLVTFRERVRPSPGVGQPHASRLRQWFENIDNRSKKRIQTAKSA